MQILARALQFDATKAKQQVKTLDKVDMIPVALPILIFHKLHQGIVNELKEREKHTKKLNIHIEKRASCAEETTRT